ncbi:terpene synthase family protein [Nonomuraea candida]|uniref:terpene synthase family protein n=1 Tax=Nonomuraea candida TaxID=359159 RepID=UPI0005BA5953|nr:terpene synthase family protein [Nonomuraea candida]
MSDPTSAYFGIRNDLADRLLKASHQLAGVPEGDRGAVLAAALDAVPEADVLLRPHTSLFADGGSASSRLAFSCLSAAATFPAARRDQIADLGALTAVLFGMDDIADSIAGDWSDGDVAAFFGRIRAVLAATGAEATPEAASEAASDARAASDAGAQAEAAPDAAMEAALGAWRAWCERFRAHPGAAAHTPSLLEQLRLAGTAMALERRWAIGGEPWPGYDRYVANGGLTILYRTWWAAALGVCGPEPADPGHWAAIERATALGAECMRLANDLRTFERERREGKPNSVLILERAGTGIEAAVERVSAHIAELNAAFAAALAELPPELAGVAEGQRRSVAFNGAWYMARDTHAYTVRDLAVDVETHNGGR